MANSKSKYIIKTNRFNADDIKNITNSSLNSERGKLAVKFGTYGLFAGVAYGILTHHSVIWSMVVGSLGGAVIGTVASSINFKKKKDAGK
jgi:hypothetical protein